MSLTGIPSGTTITVTVTLGGTALAPGRYSLTPFWLDITFTPASSDILLTATGAVTTGKTATFTFPMPTKNLHKYDFVIRWAAADERPNPAFTADGTIPLTGPDPEVAETGGTVAAGITGMGSTYTAGTARWYIDGAQKSTSDSYSATVAALGLSVGNHTLTVTATRTSDGETCFTSVGFEVVALLPLTAWTPPGIAPVGKVSNWNDLQTAISAQIAAGATTLDLSNVFGITTFGNGSSAATLTDVTSVILPGSATSIAAYAFSLCTALTSVSLPEATSIGDNAFAGTKYDDAQTPTTPITIKLGDSITSLGNWPFSLWTCYNGQSTKAGTYTRSTARTWSRTGGL
jgi:hypothetical protein